ncbi:MAG: DNA recombination protein RmuC [Deltaproteobacteria bacterium]|nr:DNA recombination protein RmuC [Candidatus Tharpella aukensis]
MEMELLASWLAEIFSGISVILLLVILWRMLVDRRVDIGKLIREEIRYSRSESEQAARRLREEVSRAQRTANETVVKTINEIGNSQLAGLGAVEKRVKLVADANEIRFDKLRETVDRQLRSMQENNEKKLEQMRQTVDEKLQSTLEKRLGESFKLVSERLEAVQRGLGDMQSLASGVGDLKRMLTNVKARGTWGEFQLGDILGQILTPDQFARNVQPKADSSAIVEYAIRLPGVDDGSSIWLPIDAKFPQEDYLRLLDAAEIADLEAVEKSTAALIRAIQNSAKDISDKYLDPPQTTDFALMFLPTEGLYSEVLRQPGLVEKLQQQYRVVVAGPTTLAAILNSLRMGFRTLAIEKRSSEVWTVLSAVKTEFGKFGEVLAKVKKQLDTASNTIEMTGARTRAMEKKLRNVEALPTAESTKLLGLETVGCNPEDDIS